MVDDKNSKSKPNGQGSYKHEAPINVRSWKRVGSRWIYYKQSYSTFARDYFHNSNS